MMQKLFLTVTPYYVATRATVERIIQVIKHTVNIIYAVG